MTCSACEAIASDVEAVIRASGIKDEALIAGAVAKAMKCPAHAEKKGRS